MVINPGYTAKTSDKDFRSEIEPGPMIYCPKCKRKLMEAEVKQLYTRCKFCRKWVFMKKTVDIL